MRRRLCSIVLTLTAVLAADTVVVRGNEALGKPENRADAVRMLRLLSGRKHRVLTGVFALNIDTGIEASGLEATEVWFRRLGAEEIDSYVATGEPVDKAGAYAIQGVGSLLVDRIRGCYFNVVGLPLVRTREVLRGVIIDR